MPDFSFITSVFCSGPMRQPALGQNPKTKRAVCVGGRPHRAPRKARAGPGVLRAQAPGNAPAHVRRVPLQMREATWLGRGATALLWALAGAAAGHVPQPHGSSCRRAPRCPASAVGVAAERGNSWNPKGVCSSGGSSRSPDVCRGAGQTSACPAPTEQVDTSQRRAS